ncbi:MAG: linear amide C-N hydrolase [Deltaproteobacteria bacterium]|nr:linear amide C-N hydrolase [Deltaproteobacteria bacterium]
MKKYYILLSIMLLTVSATTVPAGTVVTNEVILPKEPGTYMEVRHIVLRGTNEEIGKALGDIAREWLDVKLGRYASPVYAKARRLYMAKNYPILLDRMKGVAESYNLSPADDTYVTSYLVYDLAPLACSALYFPAGFTTSGHILLAHNMDFYITTLREMLGMKRVDGEHDLFSRNFIMELYPDKGYASLVVGALDLMNGFQSGMNSEGLIVAMLADNNAPANKTPSPRGDATGGLNVLQVARLILDTCATVDEARIAILNNKLTLGFEPAHFLIGDKSGKSFIYETSSKDFTDHFTGNDGKPQIMTNHSVYLYPDVNGFPSYSPRATYNSFYRYRALNDFLQKHRGKISRDDAWRALHSVYAHTVDADEGAAFPIPCRTLCPMVYDIDERSLEVKFYLKDGPTDPSTGDPKLIFSKIFRFKLAVNK